MPKACYYSLQSLLSLAAMLSITRRNISHTLIADTMMTQQPIADTTTAHKNACHN